MANTNHSNDFDIGWDPKTVITAIGNRHRAAGISSTPKNESSATRANFQRTRYATKEEDRIYKTYSVGTAASQVHYEGNELHIIEDNEERQSQQESIKGKFVNVGSLKPQTARTASNKKTESRSKILKSSQVCPRSVGNRDELMRKSHVEEATEISNVAHEGMTSDN